MPIYKYIKAPPGYTIAHPISNSTKFRQAISAIFLTLGITALTSTFYPMFAYEVSYKTRFQTSHLVSPQVTKLTSIPSSVINPVVASEPTFLPEMIHTTLDYTDSEIWFPQNTIQSSSTHPDSIYTLSINDLGIDNATVHTGAQDLKNSLIQYPGTAMPGDLGNTVIFGHSVLPQFFDPNNYITIFSTLHTLMPGQTIEITQDGATYTYEIYDMYEVMPDDLSPLAQMYDDRRLTIITCTPPGTYLRRLIIKARLI